MASNIEDVEIVLQRIATIVEECGRKIVENENTDRVVHDLITCQSNLHRISGEISDNLFDTIDQSVTELLQLAGTWQSEVSAPGENEDVFVLPSPSIPVQRGLFISVIVQYRNQCQSWQ